MIGRVREGRLAEQASLNLLCPTLDRSASLPCRTAYHNLLRPTLECSNWSVPGRESGRLEGCLLGQASRLTLRPYRTPSYTVLCFQPTTPAYHNLLRPTLECVASLPSRTLAYILSHSSIDYTGFFNQHTHTHTLTHTHTHTHTPTPTPKQVVVGWGSRMEAQYSGTRQLSRVGYGRMKDLLQFALQPPVLYPSYIEAV